MFASTCVCENTSKCFPACVLYAFQKGILCGIPGDSRGDSKGIQGDSESLLGDPRFLVIKDIYES